MPYNPKIFLVSGSPGSGKDVLIRAVNDLGKFHAVIIPKHTSRTRRPDDEKEMICVDDPNYDLEHCDITYDNYDDMYGIKTKEIWKVIQKRIYPVIVVSNPNAINKLKEIFNDLIVLLYVHSEKTAEEFKNHENLDDHYTLKRADKYRDAFNMFLRNYLSFNHVLIYSGSEEDLFDQIFRLFNYYENYA